MDSYLSSNSVQTSDIFLRNAVPSISFLYHILGINSWDLKSCRGKPTWCTTYSKSISSTNPTRTTDSHLKRTLSTNCCIHTVVPPDDGHRYARNMYILTKYTKKKLCIKLGFLYTIMSICTVNKTRDLICFKYRVLISKSKNLSP
jgi:hypothetical protein